jgi:hypothetical protein
MTPATAAMTAEEFMNANAPVPNGDVADPDPAAPPLDGGDDEAAVANMDTEEATAAAEAKEKAVKPPPMEAPDLTLIGIKVAKEFDGVPYLGEITDARKTKEGPLYKVEYRDGDVEEFSVDEVKEGQEKFVAVQTEQWNCMVGMIEGLDEDKLRQAGITSISQLELFGGNASRLEGGTPFDSLDLPLLTRQGLYIVATYLLNDQILTKDTDLATIARYNNDKANGSLPKPGKARSNSTTKRPKKKKTVVVKKAKTTVAKKPRGRPPKAAAKAATSTAKTSPAAEKSKPHSAPAVSKGAASQELDDVDYSGPPKEPIEGIADFPGKASHGWLYVCKNRRGTNHFDRYWTSPGGKTLRSHLEVQKFFKALEQTGGDEAKAAEIFEQIEM